MKKRRSFTAELFDFILSNKAYFIAPIIIVLLLVGAAIVQTARGQIAGQASTLAMAAFSMLDTARR